MAGQTRTTINISSGNTSVTSYSDKEINLSGNANLHITNPTKTLINSVVNLNSEDAFLYFDNVRSQKVVDSLLQYIKIKGAAAIQNTNTRIAIYKQGAVVVGQPSGFKPLKVFTDQNFKGDSTSYGLFTYNSSLGAFDNKIRSFKLKKGYMATLAISNDGTGYSRVYIADDGDLLVNVMPGLLDQKVSYIRVTNWEWVSKKGWAGSDFNQYNRTNSTWRYDWSAGGSTTNYVEYVPIRQNGGWPSWSDIRNKQYVSHLLGFNEPDHTEQSNLTVSQALAQWPDMLKTGLRLGAPATTNFSWLYQFMDSCNAKNYRVDYVAVHAYWGAKPAINWYNDLKAIYTRTGRPIWITEWNNGANWTTESWPTADRSLSAANAAKQLNDIKAILNVLDTASFIERYSIYNWVQDCRAMVLADTLTPAGKYYAADNPALAFNRKYEVIPTFNFKTPSLGIAPSDNKVTLTVSDPNSEYYSGYILERKINNGNFSPFAENTDASLKTYTDTIDPAIGNRVRYRLRSILSGNTYTSYTNETGYDITDGSDTIQCGILSYQNNGWNPVIFKKTYTTPVIITGAPSIYNSTVLVTPRVKFLNTKPGYFNAQIAPWSYQSATTFTKDENVPYIIFESGKNLNLGGLKAQTGRKSTAATWTKITFDTPFDTIPVVFTNQWLSSTSFPTNVRVRNITKTGFEARIMKESAVKSAIPTESVSFLAITPGTGTINGKKIIVGKTPDKTVGTAYSNISFNDSVPNPVFISQFQTCNDDSTAALRVVILNAKNAYVTKQKEKSASSVITSNFAEQAGWLVISTEDYSTGTANAITNKISLYPNPVRNILYFNTSSPIAVDADIYNIYGSLIKHMKVTDNQLNVSDISPGCYLVKIPGNIVLKFIKQ